MNLVAIDYGTALWASEDGVTSYRPIVPSTNEKNRSAGKTVLASKYRFLDLVEQLFAAGKDVVTEASTMGSFSLRNKGDELEALINKYPGRMFWNVGNHSVPNEARRQGLKYTNDMHDLAARLIWQVASRHQPRRWRPKIEKDQPIRFDPVRPNYRDLVELRDREYPDELYGELVAPYLPDPEHLTPDQRRVLASRDRAAALVCSLREPHDNRDQWLRILGASATGRPNIYRQMLVVGKSQDHKPYQYHYHYTGLRMTDFMRAIRGLRTVIQKAHPELTPPAVRVAA